MTQSKNLLLMCIAKHMIRKKYASKKMRNFFLNTFTVHSRSQRNKKLTMMNDANNFIWSRYTKTSFYLGI